MTVAGPPASRPTATTVLRQVRVGLREDLEVSRHLFRGAPSYIVRDPVTFHSQRLDLGDYAIFTAIDVRHTLAETFDVLAREGKLTRDDEEKFYQFVLHLHRLGFLRLPLADDKQLYRRFRLKQQAQWRQALVGFLFLKVPLWNPDAFLQRTLHHVRCLFTREAFVVWLLVVSAAGMVAARRWDELGQPFHGLLAGRNLAVMWVTLVVLKLFHELGHAYLCRLYGGHVPEMGAYLVIFTPCAYMDASASWGFRRKAERLAVCFGGMYVELFIAALAVLVWAMTDAPLLRSIAYNVIFLASVVTVLFNINPLMRFDGYYILSDWLEIPNLRQRSSRYLLALLKRMTLGIPQTVETGTPRLKAVLASFAVAAFLYRVALLLGIGAILAAKLHTAGVAVAAVFLGGAILSCTRKLTRYFWHAEETAQVRRRAAALGFAVLLFFPAALVVVPVPGSVRATAVVTAADEAVIRAKASGFLEAVSVDDGQLVGTGAGLAVLTNDVYAEELARNEADLEAAEIRQDAYRLVAPARELQERAQAASFGAAVTQARERMNGLAVTAPQDGRIVECVRDRDVGRYFPEGAPLAVLAAGPWQAQMLLSQDQVARSRPGIGDAVEFRPAGRPGMRIDGAIASITPIAARQFSTDILNRLAQAEDVGIVVDPVTRQTVEPWFVATVELSVDGDASSPAADIFRGMIGSVRLPTDSEPIAASLGRRILRFWNKLVEG